MAAIIEEYQNIFQITTEECSHTITLWYPPDTEKQLVDYFPKEKIIKKMHEEIILARSENADVLLNGLVFSRNHAVLKCREKVNHEDVSVVIKNTSKNKKIVRYKNSEKKTILPGNEVELEDKDKIKMDKLSFVIEIESGDVDAKEYNFQLKPQEQSDAVIPGAVPRNGSVHHRAERRIPGSPFPHSPQRMAFPEMGFDYMMSCGATAQDSPPCHGYLPPTASRPTHCTDQQCVLLPSHSSRLNGFLQNTRTFDTVVPRDSS